MGQKLGICNYFFDPKFPKSIGRNYIYGKVLLFIVNIFLLIYDYNFCRMKPIHVHNHHSTAFIINNLQGSVGRNIWMLLVYAVELFLFLFVY